MTFLVNVPKHFKEEIIPILPKVFQGIDISIITLLSYSQLKPKQKNLLQQFQPQTCSVCGHQGSGGLLPSSSVWKVTSLPSLRPSGLVRTSRTWTFR